MSNAVVLNENPGTNMCSNASFKTNLNAIK